MALTKTSIIKTRSQSRTGTKARTTAPAAPTPVAVATGGRTTGTNVRTNDRTIDTHVAPITDDLFAGRPKTGALKDPPPARDRDLNDDAMKPAAKPKPKGRPKKVVAPTARKPRKSRAVAVDANELVDPMANIHVDDATGVVTAGGLARAGGNDPVLADPDYKKSGTPRSGTVR